MGSDIPLGRIAGIKVGMNITVLLVAGLFTVALATKRFPFEQPGLPESAYWIAGAGGALLLFASLLVHEIGHALVARDEGIGVHSMALTLLGGVTRMESSPATPAAELRVSVVGPLASAACGVFLLCVSYVLPSGGLPGLVGFTLSWAGVLNLTLAAFNLIPATPLDGGKVLSALIWMRTGNQAVAMRWAAWTGIATGSGLILAGVRELQRHNVGSWGIWFAVVGGFILMSAVHELQAVPLYSLLDGVTVAEAMAPAPPTAAPWSTVADFLRTANPGPDDQAYPVVGTDGRVTALLTATAIRSVPSERRESLPVSQLAFPIDRVVHLSPAEPLLPALQKVEGSDLRHGIVIDASGRVVGTVDPSALHRAVTVARAGLATVRP
ncbi:MAG: peptidase [Acidimicrobiales bacterium]|nr:peptidase [Acidimicrobiales bacterium]